MYASLKFSLTPTKNLIDIIPQEAHNKIKLEVSRIFLFDSEAWDHNPDEKNKALQPKSESCNFLYSKHVKDYRLLQCAPMKLLIEEILILIKIYLPMI